jgi:hypothetical protein
VNKRLKLLTIGLIAATSLLSTPKPSTAELSVFNRSGNYLVYVSSEPKGQRIHNPSNLMQLVTISSDARFSLRRVTRHPITGDYSYREHGFPSSRMQFFLNGKESVIIVFNPLNE